jgi:hypothetical protein
LCPRAHASRFYDKLWLIDYGAHRTPFSETRILEDQFFNLPQVVRADSAISRQQDCRVKPELALSVRRANVNVRGLVSFIGIEMKPERANAEEVGTGPVYHARVRLLQHPLNHAITRL